jgi:hypothetical protein
MTKTAFQAAKTKAAFQWDPNNDQTFNDSTIPPLQGPASSFDKARGKSFTMDAPGQTLTLQITPSDMIPSWGSGSGTFHLRRPYEQGRQNDVVVWGPSISTPRNGPVS